MKLFDVVKKQKGKETVLLTGSLKDANARLKQLKNSSGKQTKGIDYSVRDSSESTKYVAPKKNHQRN